ncbi:MAG: hypothetical protein AABW54_02940 [Candidatus Micrarchaeota archaeon]
MRGFASIIIAAMVLALSVATVGMQLAAGAELDSLNAKFEADQVGWRHADARAFYSAAVTDVVVDSAYYACGCGVNAPSNFNNSLAALLPIYFQNSSRALSTRAVTVNASLLGLPSVGLGSCNSTFSFSFNYTVTANSSNARKFSVVNESRAVTLFKNSTALAVNATGGIPLRLIVTCG